MKVFISSLITGMEDIRAATKSAIEALGHTAVMAEDFGTRPQSPQVACLDGLRRSSLVVLILGADYGSKQASGISATHEEYSEAKGSRPVIAFVQEDVTREPDEAEFVREVQAWEGGLFRGGFRSADQLKSLVTRAIHEWELSVASAPLDGQEMLGRALAAFGDRRDSYRGRSGTALSMSIAAGPGQSILRPSEIERESFADTLMQGALFGPTRLFMPSRSTGARIDNDAPVIEQEDEGNLIRSVPRAAACLAGSQARASWSCRYRGRDCGRASRDCALCRLASRSDRRDTAADARGNRRGPERV